MGNTTINSWHVLNFNNGIIIAFCKTFGIGSYSLYQFNYPISFTTNCKVFGTIAWNDSASRTWFTATGVPDQKACTDIIGNTIGLTLSSAYCNAYSHHHFIIIGF